MNIALLSNVNIDPLEKYLKKDYSFIYLSHYNHLFTALLDNTSVLYAAHFDIVFLYLDGDEMLKKYMFDPINLDIVQADVQNIIINLFAAIEGYIDRKKDSILMLNTIVFSPYKVTNYLERNSPYSRSIVREWINNQFSIFAQKHSGVLIYDWQNIISKYGYDNLCDDRFWYLGRIKLNSHAFSILGIEIGRLFAAYQGKIRKVLALDLDNTLWGGIIGEDGIEGIQLSEDGIGKVYMDFQRAIKALKSLGVILVLCSKNNYSDVKEAFDRHPMILLKFSDFAAVRINWEDKVTNLRAIAEELNLGLDAFVFIDDNPIERAFISKHIPEVAVPIFPNDETRIVSWFVDDVVNVFFPKISVTEEDRSKTEQYLANKQRESFGSSLDLDAFIQGLEIKLTLHEDNSLLSQRTAQMTQKTNQFNVTTKRYTASHIEGFLKSPEWIVFNQEYEDIFGKEGIIGTAIVKLNDGHALLDSFLLSCRVIGRNVEFSFMDQIINALKLKRKIITKLYAEYSPSERNAIAADFFEKAGFTVIMTDDSGIKKYIKDI